MASQNEANCARHEVKDIRAGDISGQNSHKTTIQTFKHASAAANAFYN